MPKFIFRFPGDPCGYVTEDGFDYRLKAGTPQWVDAKVGATSQEVLIDITKAYIREIDE